MGRDQPHRRLTPVGAETASCHRHVRANVRRAPGSRAGSRSRSGFPRSRPDRGPHRPRAGIRHRCRGRAGTAGQGLGSRQWWRGSRPGPGWRLVLERLDTARGIRPAVCLPARRGARVGHVGPRGGRSRTGGGGRPRRQGASDVRSRDGTQFRRPGRHCRVCRTVPAGRRLARRERAAAWEGDGSLGCRWIGQHRPRSCGRDPRLRVRVRLDRTEDGLLRSLPPSHRCPGKAAVVLTGLVTPRRRCAACAPLWLPGRLAYRLGC